MVILPNVKNDKYHGECYLTGRDVFLWRTYEEDVMITLNSAGIDFTVSGLYIVKFTSARVICCKTLQELKEQYEQILKGCEGIRC